MAFGKGYNATETNNAQNTNSGEKIIYTFPFMPINRGTRTFRILPEVVNGVVNFNETESEVTWGEVWWPVNLANGNRKQRRFIFALRDLYRNPIWTDVAERTEKGDKERAAFKRKFAINVLDKSPVILDENGQPIYQDENNKFVLTPMGKKLDAPLSGKGQPLNQVRVLEGSYNDRPGKHLFGQFINLVGTDRDGNPTGTLEDSEGNVITHLHQTDLKIKNAGTGEGPSVITTANFKPVSEEFALLPRYDLARWASPWPMDAVQALYDGAVYEEVAEQYGLLMFPQLSVPEADVDEIATDVEEEELFD